MALSLSRKNAVCSKGHYFSEIENLFHHFYLNGVAAHFCECFEMEEELCAKTLMHFCSSPHLYRLALLFVPLHENDPRLILISCFYVLWYTNVLRSRIFRGKIPRNFRGFFKKGQGRLF